MVSAVKSETKKLDNTIRNAPNSRGGLAANHIRYTNPAIYRSSYVYTIDFGQSVVTKTDAYVPTPTEWDSQKNVTLTSFSPSGSIGIDSSYSNEYIHFDQSHLIGNTISTVQFFNFRVYEISADTFLENLQPYDTGSLLYQTYTRDEPKLETNFFTGITPGIVGTETNPIKKAKKIYDFVIDYLTYSNIGGAPGAVYAWTHKTGACGDFSALFVALARSTGIPARPVVGWWADTNCGTVHVWAEFYVQDIGWIPVDPTIGQQSSANRIYYFGNLDNKRLIMSKNYNIPLDGYNAGLFQIGACWWWGSGAGYTVSASYKNY
jgi:hypothetical protein